MKLVTYQLKDDHSRGGIGILRDQWVFDVPTCAQFLPPAERAMLEGLSADLLALLDRGEAAVAAAKSAADLAEGRLREPGEPFAYALDSVRLLAPLPMPRKLFCLAGNYGEHIREGGGDYPGKEKMTPRFFMKPASTTVTHPGDPILISRHAQCTDWEIELGVVIGKKGKYISAAEAYDYVLGYTVVNDVSERKLKVSPQREPRDMDGFFDWLNGKWLDSFAPMGPCIATKDEVGDVMNLRITLSVNGDLKQDGNTGQMIFDPAELIEFISSYVTLEPGDVISTGTPSGVGSTTGTFLKDGDVVVGEVEKIGRLENPVCAEDDKVSG